jgi:hypothetical protein
MVVTPREELSPKLLMALSSVPPPVPLASLSPAVSLLSVPLILSNPATWLALSTSKYRLEGHTWLPAEDGIG